MMKKQFLGKSGLEVSQLALGTDLIGSKIDQRTSFALFNFYRGHGGNFLNTANFYASWLPGCHGREREGAIGAWMKQRKNRDDMIISSKLRFDYPRSPGGLTAQEIQKECEKSLIRLQTYGIDLYYTHRDDQATPMEETMEAFHRLIEQGKVRAVGASNLAVWRIVMANVLAEKNGWTPYCVVEQRYTYLRPRHGADFGPQIFISSELKDYALSNGIALVGYFVLVQGAYTRTEREIPAQFAGQDSDQLLTCLKSVAAEVGCSPNQVVIAWIRQSQPSILPIIAGSKIEQLKENIDALNLVLSKEQMQKLTSAGDPDIKRA